jgi:hypothetical protein
LAKGTKRRRRGVLKEKTKRRGGHAPGLKRRKQEAETDEKDDEVKFTYQGTFTQKDDDL